MENSNTLVFVLRLLYRINRQYSLSDNRGSNRRVFKSLAPARDLHNFLVFF